MPLAVIALLIPITALLIPIVGILTGHQRQMAELMRQNGGSEVEARLLYEVECMRREMAELRNLINHQTIAIDNLSPQLPTSMTDAEKLERMGL